MVEVNSTYYLNKLWLLLLG